MINPNPEAVNQAGRSCRGENVQDAAAASAQPAVSPGFHCITFPRRPTGSSGTLDTCVFARLDRLFFYCVLKKLANVQDRVLFVTAALITAGLPVWRGKAWWLCPKQPTHKCFYEIFSYAIRRNKQPGRTWKDYKQTDNIERMFCSASYSLPAS